ncbi:hypothetical protein NliqN6_2702 [Naganishia liquefaciens]|uniref:AMP-dependent synthetase/ligase domain-containing protein n=1 Tax=Naganishia liquefaciens TaxID=104408 RepID=A0A8H3TSA7_9TREE|nr:hypothetical protein NliqN6_2702 [Naganishia liquefaciens]
MPFTIHLDDPSLLLLALIVALALLIRSGIFTAQPAAHPLVFAKQGEPSPVRKEGRSAAYRHWSGNTAIIPASGVKGVREIVAARNGEAFSVDGKVEDVWTTAGRLVSGLRKRVPATESSSPIVTFLPTSQKTLKASILLNLVPAHANGNGYHLVVASESKHLSEALTDAKLVFARHEDVTEVISATAIVGGCIILPSADGLTRDLRTRVEEKGWQITTLDEVVASGDGELPSAADPSDSAQVHAIFIADGPDGKPVRRTMTNQNITAALVSLLALFPGATRPTKRHTLLTSVDMAQPIGTAIVLLALYTGKGIRWVQSAQSLETVVNVGRGDQCIAFLSTPQLNAISEAIASGASRHPLYSFAKRRKEAAIYEGALPRGGWLDGAVFEANRSWVQSLTAVVLVDSVSNLHPSQLADALVHLSVPIIRTLAIPQAVGPICATHHHDLQLLAFDQKMHVGPPAACVEIELRGEETQFADSSRDPKGSMFARGPTILSDSSNSIDTEGWAALSKQAIVRSNGTFVTV